MKAIRILSLALVLGVSSQQVSCSRDSTKKEDSADDPKIDSLYGDIRTIEKDFSQGFLLRSAQDDQKVLFADVVQNIKIAIMRLRKDPMDGPALSALFIAQQELMSLNILAQDASQIDGFKTKLSETLDYIAGLQGKVLDQVERVLFSTRFSQSLEPFNILTAGSNKTGWIKSNHEEVNYAYAKTGKSDTELHTWLFSPTFDLTNVRNPRFNVKQSINRYGKPISDAVFILVSDNYTGGEVTDATWEYVQFARVPDGSNFAAIQSEDYDLSRYSGKKITIAFQYRFKSPENYKNDGPAWQLNSVNLMGNGPFAYEKLDLTNATLKDLTIPAARNPGNPAGAPALVAAPKVSDTCKAAGAQTLFGFQFNKSSVGGNFTTQAVPETISFAPKSYLNVVRFSGYGGDDGNKKGVSWLISKAIDITNAKDVCLSVAESVYFPNKTIDLTKAQILVSTDYAGDPSQATWVAGLKSRNAISGTANSETLNPIAAGASLNDLIPAGATKVFIAFRYEATADAAPWWGVSDLNVTAVPSGTGALKLDQAETVSKATDKPSPKIDPNVATACKELEDGKDFFSHQFSTPIAGSFEVFDELKNINPTAVSTYPGALRFSGFGEPVRVGKSLLVTKALDVSQVKDACLSVADVVNFPKPAKVDIDLTKIKVSTNYAGDPAKATWVELKLKGRSGIAGGVKKDAEFVVTANSIMLTDILKTNPKTLVVAFEYESKADSQPWWGLTDLTIRVVPKTPSAMPQPAPAVPVDGGGETDGDSTDPIVVNPS
ncbi:MAG: hypothetical protein EOP04_08330 [Proteobacteria bacterium]|nr:MAG: hypothetical protein EOP04_08330 [Pseudomonadota bacterium]